jgi:hypothetical protein
LRTGQRQAGSVFAGKSCGHGFSSISSIGKRTVMGGENVARAGGNRQRTPPGKRQHIFCVAVTADNFE